MKITEKRSNRPLEKGDVIALYGNDTEHFRLAIALDETRAVKVFDVSTGVEERLLNLLKNVSNEDICLSTLRLPDELLLEKLREGSYEIYNINILSSPQNFEKTLTDFFEVLEKNLSTLQRLVEGDIVKMHGLKLMDRFALYHHHVIYSDAKKCKVIHKWGELNKYEILRNVMGENFEHIGVREDNLLEVAFLREITVSNCYDERYNDQIKQSNKIVSDARERIGETGYDLMTDNCQHFCTDCRYGIAVAIEVENTKMAVTATIVGASLIAGAVGAFAAYRQRKSKQVKRSPV